MTKYLVIDVETNGMQNFKLPADDPSQPHIASMALLFVGDDMALEREFDCLIKPDGWIMTPEVTAINGLTTERLEAEGIPIIDALKVFAEGIAEDRVVVGHNVQFDLKCVRGAMRRAAMPDLFEQTKNICTMRALTDVCKIPPKGNRGGYKWPSLSEACVFFHFENFGDHSAKTDALACYMLLRKMAELKVIPEPAVHYAKDKPVTVATPAHRATLRAALIASQRPIEPFRFEKAKEEDF